MHLYERNSNRSQDGSCPFENIKTSEISATSIRDVVILFNFQIFLIIRPFTKFVIILFFINQFLDYVSKCVFLLNQLLKTKKSAVYFT